ncbi:swr complex subunit [Podila humilis]|nr:swr complex subunit [Podila humilis]
MPNPPKQEKPVESDSESSEDEDYIPDDVDDVKSDGEDDSDDSDKGQSDNEADVSNDYSTTRSGKRLADTSGAGSSKKSRQDLEQALAVNEEQAQVKKSKIDALWAEMNAPIVKQPFSTRTDTGAASSLSSSSSSSLQGTDGSSSSAASKKMVTITTSYDFAGEMITVTKDVPEDSKEAKEFAQKNKPCKESLPSDPIPHSDAKPTDASQTLPSSALGTEKKEGEKVVIQSQQQGPRTVTRPSILDSLAKKSGPVRYVRKKSTLDELASTYGVKKPMKMSTLEKSKLDWNQFVGKEGIEDELKQHNKDGYMEKVAFLQRTEARRDEEYQNLKKKRT